MTSAKSVSSATFGTDHPVVARVAGYRNRLRQLRWVVLVTEVLAAAGVVVGIGVAAHSAQTVAGTVRPNLGVGIGLAIVSALLGMVALAVYLASGAVTGD